MSIYCGFCNLIHRTSPIFETPEEWRQHVKGGS